MTITDCHYRSIAYNEYLPCARHQAMHLTLFNSFNSFFKNKPTRRLLQFPNYK